MSTTTARGSGAGDGSCHSQGASHGFSGEEIANVAAVAGAGAVPYRRGRDDRSDGGIKRPARSAAVARDAPASKAYPRSPGTRSFWPGEKAWGEGDSAAVHVNRTKDAQRSGPSASLHPRPSHGYSAWIPGRCHHGAFPIFSRRQGLGCDKDQEIRDARRRGQGVWKGRGAVASQMARSG